MASLAPVAQTGQPGKPEDLRKCPSLSHALPQENQTWALENMQGETSIVQHSPRYIITDRHALKLAALASVGVVQLPVLMLQKELQTGALAWLPRF